MKATTSLHERLWNQCTNEVATDMEIVSYGGTLKIHKGVLVRFIVSFCLILKRMLWLTRDFGKTWRDFWGTNGFPPIKSAVGRFFSPSITLGAVPFSHVRFA